jgi:hypothetical protein
MAGMIKQPFENKLNKRNRMVFSEPNVRSLRPKRRQYVVWDGGLGRGAGKVARGLHILVSPMGAKSYRSMFYSRLVQILQPHTGAGW